MRLGLHPRDWRETSARHLATDRARPASGPHALQHAAALSEHLTGTALGRQDPAVDTDEVLAAEELLERHVPGARPFLLVHLARPGDPRSWPKTRYRELAREAARMDIEALFLSGPDEAELGRKLEEEEPSIKHWVGQRGLRELAAIFTAAARRGAHLLACDSGPMHLAAACDLPVMLLAGPQDPRATGPMAWGPLHSALQSALPPACSPCKQRICHHPRGAVCMSDLTAARALDAIEASSQGAISCA